MRLLAMGFFYAFLLFANFSLALNLISEEKIYKTHKAIFESYLPSKYQHPSSDEKAMIEIIDEEIWRKVKEDMRLQFILQLYSNFEQLTDPNIAKIYNHLFAKNSREVKLSTCKSIEPVRKFLSNNNAYGCLYGMKDLNVADRRLLVEMLIQSDGNYWRMLGFFLKTYYVSQIYKGKFGRYISGLGDYPGYVPLLIPHVPAFKTHLAYDEKKGEIIGDIDYLIIGSGAAGAVIGYRLTEAGFKVLMIEKGSFLLPGGMDTVSNFDFMESSGPIPEVEGNLLVFAGRGGGGTTLANMNILIPLKSKFVSHRFRTWHERGLVPSYLFTKEQVEKSDDFIQRLLKPRTLKLEDVNDNNRYLAKGAEALGINFSLHQVTTYAPEENPYTVTDKRSALDSLIIPAMLNEENPMTLLPDCEVVKIRIKSKRARGVTCVIREPLQHDWVLRDIYGWEIPKGTKLKINAKKIVLAAGALGDSSILLKTKKIHNKNKGRGFTLHPSFPVIFEAPKPINMDNGAVSGVFIDEYITTNSIDKKPDFLIETAEGDRSMGAILVPGNPDEIGEGIENTRYRGGAAVVLFDSVNYENRIELDQFGNPIIRYTLSEEGKERAIFGVCELMRIFLAAGATKISFFSHEDVLFDYDLNKFGYISNEEQIEMVRKNLKLIPNRNFIISGHINGSNKMGTSSENSVVDEHFHVHDVSNLDIADLSILPESPHVNPMPVAFLIGHMYSDQELGLLKN